MTAWVAPTQATKSNDRTRFVLGSHRIDPVEHKNTCAPDNNLSHGQTAKLVLGRWQAFDDILEPGETSLHHTLLEHGSGRNASAGDRVGICIRHLPRRIHAVGGPPVPAKVVRGGRHANLVLEDPPDVDLAPKPAARHTRLLDPMVA